MVNVAKSNLQHPGFPYTPDQLRQVAAAVRNEGYPPQGRAGIGTVVRKAA